MPIREWKETIKISIECSDQELPRVVAALQGQKLLPTPVYNVTNNSHTIAMLPAPKQPGFSDADNYIRALKRSMPNG